MTAAFPGTLLSGGTDAAANIFLPFVRVWKGSMKGAFNDHRHMFLSLNVCKARILLVCTILHVGFTSCPRKGFYSRPPRNISTNPYRKCSFTLVSYHRHNAFVWFKYIDILQGWVCSPFFLTHECFFFFITLPFSI